MYDVDYEATHQTPSPIDLRGNGGADRDRQFSMVAHALTVEHQKWPKYFEPWMVEPLPATQKIKKLDPFQYVGGKRSVDLSEGKP